MQEHGGEASEQQHPDQPDRTAKRAAAAHAALQVALLSLERAQHLVDRVVGAAPDVAVGGPGEGQGRAGGSGGSEGEGLREQEEEDLDEGVATQLQRLAVEGGAEGLRQHGALLMMAADRIKACGPMLPPPLFRR